MDIVENHRIKLLNAKCEVVCQAEYLMKKLQNGDAIECCIKKLFAAIKLINRLDCYCFPTLAQDIPGQETITVTTGAVVPLDGEYFITASGQEIGPRFRGTGLELLEDVIILVLDNNTAGLTYTIDYTETETVFIISTSCEYDNLILWGFPEDGEPYQLNSVVVTEPVCTNATTCNNCSTDAELSKYYQVLDNLLK